MVCSVCGYVDEICRCFGTGPLPSRPAEPEALSTDELVELGYTGDVAAKARDEIIRLRARERQMVDAIRSALAKSSGGPVWAELRAALEKP